MKEVPNMWVGAVQYTQTNKHYCAANWFYCAQTPRVNSLLYECVYSGLYTVHCVLHALCTSPPSPVSCCDERRGGGGPALYAHAPTYSGGGGVFKHGSWGA
jgi:hypothetical protein